MVKKKNNNKSYGLGKERELKKILGNTEGIIECTRSRGSFGSFDIQAYGVSHCDLVSVKSTRQKYWSPNKEIEKLRDVIVPVYCRKWLYIWWAPHKDRDKRGWEVIEID